MVIIALLIAAIAASVYGAFNDKEYTVTVTDKGRITRPIEGEDGKQKIVSEYMVYADGPDGEPLVFKNVDCSFRGKFDSHNMQGSLKRGHTYRITVVGWRVPFLNMAENIIKAEEVGQ